MATTTNTSRAWLAHACRVSSQRPAAGAPSRQFAVASKNLQSSQVSLSAAALSSSRHTTSTLQPRARGLVISCAAGPSQPSVNAVAVTEAEPIKPTILGLDAKTVRIASSVLGWFFLNAVFAIYNKKTLNCFPYPWILSWIQIATGAAMMIALWTTKLLPAPKLTMDTYKTLVPTATLHLIAHVSACASYNFSSVSFMQVVKAAEPACSVIILTLFYRKRYSALVWLTLVPIVLGVAGGSMNELNFSTIAFAMAMISNVACALRGVTSKEAQEKIGLQGINLYAAIAIVSSVLLLPPTLLVEGRFLQTAFENAGPAMVKLGYGATAAAFLPFLLTGSVLYHLYNQTSYQALAEMSPLSHSIANTVKRVVIILASIAIFKNPITPIGATCAAIAIGGTFLYSLARQKQLADEEKSADEQAAPKSAVE